MAKFFHLLVEESPSPIIGSSVSEVPPCNCPPVPQPNNGGENPPSGAGDSFETTTGQLSPIENTQAYLPFLNARQWTWFIGFVVINTGCSLLFTKLPSVASKAIKNY